MGHIRVLLAEDHALVREGTREMLERDPEIDVVGEAGDGLAAVMLAAELAPDVVLLDIGLPLLNGIEAAERIRAAPNPPRILVLSAYDDLDYARAAIRAGAGGYLLKTAHARDVVAAVIAVAGGEVVFHPSVARQLLDGRPSPASGHVLSEREHDILRLVARGARTKEIARHLGVSTRTIESQLTSIFNKLGVSGRTEAVLYAVSRGWIAIEAAPESG